MRRTANAALAISFAVAGFASVAAAGDAGPLVDCQAEDGATLVVEGEPFEETYTGAAFTYPYGEFGAAGADEPTGGAFAEYYQLQIPVAYNHVDGQRPTATVEISWDTVSDIDLDVLASDGTNVGEDHAFNIDSQDFSATAIFAPEPCETYTVVINNSYAVPAQAITMTTSVTSKAPRSRG